MNTLYAHALLGGIIIGLSALLLAGGLGRVMGMSGILKGILPKRETGLWRYLFLLWIPLGSSLYLAFDPNYAVTFPGSSILTALAGGILVGLGTSLANGCTSGHSVCGVGRLSIRSIIATTLFVISGIITVFITHHMI